MSICKDTPALQEVEWQDIRTEVKRVNKPFADIIDKLSLNKRYKLIKATYKFGDLIIKDGVTYLPGAMNSISSINDLKTDAKVKNKLLYSPIPLLLILKRSCEVFIDKGARVIPLNTFEPGSFLGLFEIMDYLYRKPNVPKWSVSSGARSIFMLPKINEAIGFKKLRIQYNLPSSTVIKDLSDHWHVFKLIASSPSFSQEWQTEILFFTEDWFKHFNDPAWFEFFQYLIGNSWQNAQFAISKIDLGLNWEYFSEAISSRNLKPSIYLADQLKHIIYIAAGMWPGFRPADDSLHIAPITGLQEAFTEFYSLKHYLPTMMYACMLRSDNKLPVYYSLHHSVLVEGSPKNRSSSTIIFDLRNIKLLLDTLKRAYKHDTKFSYDFINKANFDFFHVEPDKFQEIKSSQLIPETDSSFLLEQKTHKDRAFCSTSSFWRGCVKIMLT